MSDGREARLRVYEALDILRVAVGDYLRVQLAAQPGAYRRADLQRLLGIFIDRFPELQLERGIRTLAFAAKDARNELAHYTGTLTADQALHHLSVVRRLLEAIDAGNGLQEVDGFYREQMRALQPAHGQEEAAEPDRQRSRKSATDSRVELPVAKSASVGTSQADRIRAFAAKRFVAPARQAGEDTVVIRAGDVGRLMGLTGRVANVCNALRGRKFEALANVKLVDQSGPRASTTTEFMFTIDE